MPDRQVTHSDKKDGDIIGLCWEGTDGLKYVSRGDAINHIVGGTHRYYVSADDSTVWVVARPKAQPTYLTTEADGVPTNNLDNLPGCTIA